MPDEKMRIQVCVKLPCLATVLATLARALPRLPGPCHGCPSLATGLATGARALPRTVARLGQAWQGPWQAWQGPWKARQGPWQGSATRGKDRGKARPSVARPVGPCHGCPSLATGARALPRVAEPCHGPCHACHSPCHACPRLATVLSTGARALPRALPRAAEPCHALKHRGLGGVASSEATVFWSFIFRGVMCS